MLTEASPAHHSHSNHELSYHAGSLRRFFGCSGVFTFSISTSMRQYVRRAKFCLVVFGDSVVDLDMLG